jgi:hypothetical protein
MLLIIKEIRSQKWHKARPIAPQTKHPMSNLFKYTGRAWSFLAANLEGEHFVLNNTEQLPAFLERAQLSLAPHGKLHVAINDIEGCFPNMDKEAIKFGLRAMTARITKKHGHDTVCVPRRKTQPCCFSTRRKHDVLKFPFEMLHDVIEFVLENTLIQDLENQLMKQVKGIPMGDPHSPGMTIGTCAWMEHEWMQTLGDQAKQSFMAKRYMDDIIMLYVNKPNIDSAMLLKDFKKSECYLPPLKLEDAGTDTFLETSFEITADNRVRYWLKNNNQVGQPPRIWRYAHFHSYMPFPMKRAVMMSCLKKVHRMASGPCELYESGIKKIAEYLQLQYPEKMVWTACTTMGVHTRNPTWFDIRDNIHYERKNPIDR